MNQENQNTTPATVPVKKDDKVLTYSNFKEYLAMPNVSNRFDQILGQRAPQFTAALVQIVLRSKALSECTYDSIVGSAINAAALDLAVDPNIGHAHLVPYKNRKAKTSTCQLQIGYKGLIQLAQRSGQYHRLGYAVIHEGELISWDELSGDLVWDKSKRTSEKVIGYAAKFRLVNGFERSSYWTREEVLEHAKRFSQAYRYGLQNTDSQDSPWFTDEQEMALKTVLKDLLSKWGPLSVQMQRAVEADQSASDGAEGKNYPDNPQAPDMKNVTPPAEPKTGSSRLESSLADDDDDNPFGSSGKAAGDARE